MVVYQKNLVISQLLTNIAIAAIENYLLTLDFPLRDGDFRLPMIVYQTVSLRVTNLSYCIPSGRRA